ncbi:A disintegrin and metalloproteinase with thrombospondin motifs 6-like isoform X5 [Mytilus edulis]|uniref:A disintegrin and metalloproteinase with thrombospondin motifs 6-like isoform X5 n=1 Tax=Mytilus edulis TaxID=6550 RepID=UPI0039EFA386
MNIFIFYSIWIFTILTSIKCKVKDKPPDILDQFRNWDINDSPEVLSSIRVELLDNHIYRRSVSSRYDISLKFSLSSKPVILKLQQNAQLSSRIPVYAFAQNGSIIQEDLPTDLHDVNYYYDTSNGASFYIESIDGLRSHMYGTFHFENEEYILEFKNNNSVVTHKESQQPKSIYHFKIRKTSSQTREDSSSQTYHLKNLNNPIYTNINKTFTEHRRKKRAPSYHVEVLFVVDYSIYKHWYDQNRGSSAQAIHSIRQIYAFVANGMDGRYKSMSPNFIGIAFAGIIICKTPSESEWTESLRQTHETPNLVDAHQALEKFKDWVQKKTDLPSNDHAMLLTRYSLSSGQSSSLEGYAYVGAICSPSSQSIMEESEDYSMITVAAHELGHSLGANHDGQGNSCKKDDFFIMAATNMPSMGNPNPWRFSSCSVNYFHQTIRRLDSNRKNCLTSFGPSYNPNEIRPYLAKLPGQLYTADEQCQSRHGDKSSLCREQYQGDYRQMCGLMWCRDITTQGCKSMVPADGTLCASKHWCINGVCTYSSGAASTPAKCAHGDYVGSMDNRGNTCTQIVAKDKTECYRDRIGQSCCASCAKVSSGVTDTISGRRPRYRRTTVKTINYLLTTTPFKGCFYGDRIPTSLCNKTACPYYQKEELSHCCNTCSAYFSVPDPNRLPTESDGTTEILIGVSVAIVIIAVICGIYIHRRGGNSGGRHKIPLKGRSIQDYSY